MIARIRVLDRATNYILKKLAKQDRATRCDYLTHEHDLVHAIFLGDRDRAIRQIRERLLRQTDRSIVREIDRLRSAISRAALNDTLAIHLVRSYLEMVYLMEDARLLFRER